MLVALPIIMDDLQEWKPVITLAFDNGKVLKYKDVRISYANQDDFDPTVLYILREGFLPTAVTEGNTFVCLSAERPELGKNHVLALDYPYSPEQLCSAISNCICGVGAWDNQMNLEIIDGCDAQKLLDLSQAYLKNPLVILDSTFCGLAVSNNITEEDALYYDIKLHGMPSPETILLLSKQNKNRQFTYGQFESGLTYRVAAGPVNYPEVYIDIKVDESIMLALNMRLSRAPLSPGLVAILGVFADKLQKLYTLQRYTETNTGIISFNEYLFPRIICGDKEAMALAENSDLFRRDYMIATSNSTSVRALARKVVATTPGTCVFSYEENFFVFVPIDLFNESSAYYIKSQEKRLAQIGEVFSAGFGLSGPFQGSETLAAACRQSMRALELQDMAFSRDPENTALQLYRDIAFADMAAYYCKDHPLRSFASLSYIAMRENDKKHGTNYCAFVKTYILSGCSSSKTAQLLFLHKNSVIYRLEKIKERFNLDISDMHEQMLFLLACTADECAERLLTD